jgi:uncharacterized membrane protein
MIFIQKMATKLAAIFFVWSYNTIMNAVMRRGTGCHVQKAGRNGENRSMKEIIADKTHYKTAAALFGGTNSRITKPKEHRGFFPYAAPDSLIDD